MNEYRYIKHEIKRDGDIDCILSRPITCNTIFFIEAFWVPIRKQIDKKLVLIFKSRSKFNLLYNQLSIPHNIQQLSQEKIAEFVQQDTEETLNKALRHIDETIARMYNDDEYNGKNIVPFIGEFAIKSIEEHTITMNGRLPMREEYFVKRYWHSLTREYKTLFPGIQFKIHFSESKDQITPSLIFKRRDASAKKHNKDIRNEDANPILHRVTCDLADAILQAASEYFDACK